MGVHPAQRMEAMAEADRLGIPTEFNEQGQAVFRDRNHRKRYCEAFGYFDRDGGYSDPQPHGNVEERFESDDYDWSGI